MKIKKLTEKTLILVDCKYWIKMDSTAQIKNNLIARIKDSEDLNFLKALQTIFDASEQKLYQLSSEQNDAISSGRKQIKKGQFSSHESVISEMKEWLAKK